MGKIVYDGKDAVFGRLASAVAKDLLKGNFVDVINCEGIIISGDKKLFVEKILAKRKMGGGSSLKGPRYPITIDRLIKRMIRGMLPWDRMKGREAYKRLRCHIGEVKVDGEVKKLNHKKPMKYASVKEIGRLLK